MDSNQSLQTAKENHDLACETEPHESTGYEKVIFNFSVMNIKRGHKCNRNPHPNAKKENSHVANDACMNVLCGIL